MRKLNVLLESILLINNLQFSSYVAETIRIHSKVECHISDLQHHHEDWKSSKHKTHLTISFQSNILIYGRKYHSLNVFGFSVESFSAFCVFATFQFDVTTCAVW